MEKCICMNVNELKRLEIVIKVIEKRLKQVEAADILDISVRQRKRLVKQFRVDKQEGLVSKKKRGSSSNHQLPKGLKEVHDVKISISTVRALMIEKELFKPKRHKKKRIFQYRERRPRKGEMLQMDGSPHDFLEGRAVKCSLIYLVDDATSEIMAARFEMSETKKGYFHLMEDHIVLHGRPPGLTHEEISLHPSSIV